MMNPKHTCLAAVASAAALFVPSVASADFLKRSFHAANFSFTSPTVLVPINSGATVLSFTLTAPDVIVVTFSAECSVNAPAGNSGAWVDIDLRLDGVAIVPTAGTSDAFCGADGVSGFGHWTRVSITTAVSVPAGTHTISVLGRLNFGATGGLISDSSLVLEQ
jgi:hypothetical protein